MRSTKKTNFKTLNLSAVYYASLCGMAVALSAQPLWARDQAPTFSNSLYAGIDQQMRHIAFQKDFGGNILHKDYRQNNVFAGFKFHEHFGLEAGYQWTDPKSSWTRVNAGDQLYGNVVLAGDYTDTVNSLRASGPSLDLVGSYEFKADQPYKTIFSLAVGITRSYLGIKYFPTGIQANTSSAEQLTSLKRHFHDQKITLRIAPAVEFHFFEKFGVRARFIYENLSNLTLKSSIVSSPAQFTAKPKNSSCAYGLGFFIKF